MTRIVSQAFVLARDFIFGNNETGLVTHSSGFLFVVGGEDETLAAPILPGQLGIYKGAGATQSTYTFPSVTIAAWNTFIADVTAVATSTASDFLHAASSTAQVGS